jgi:hypothetical protein
VTRAATTAAPQPPTSSLLVHICTHSADTCPHGSGSSRGDESPFYFEPKRTKKPRSVGGCCAGRAKAAPGRPPAPARPAPGPRPLADDFDSPTLRLVDSLTHPAVD